MLLNRLLTAAVAIPLVLAIIFYGGNLGFFLLVLAVVGFGLYEYFSFIYPQKVNIQIIAHTILGLILPVAFYFGYPDFIVPAVAFILIFSTAFSLFRVTDPQMKAENLFTRLFGIFYVAFLLSYLIVLRKLPHGAEWVVLALAINFGTDAGAYFAGRFFGRHPLYAVISPKKTVEGAIGGIILCFVFVIIAKYVLIPELKWADVLALGLVASILAVLGDMAESLIKRGFKVKDAGGILPGHGGILDRIDSFVFSAPFIFYYAAYCL
ncbi:MAG: phosphatidate cytidylyltransferase [Deltaproteobacteria bacterium]|nr:phosphatidate cytidylyltransferase [Candidatus Zymogenaceae bacterium]